MNARGTRRPHSRKVRGGGRKGSNSDKITVGEMMGCGVVAVVSVAMVTAGAVGVVAALVQR